MDPRPKQNTRSRIEDLHQGVKTSKIKDLKEALKSGVAVRSPESLKKEINAISAWAIEDIWTRVLAKLSSDPQIADFSDYTELYLENKNRLSSMACDRFHEGTNAIVSRELVDWINYIENPSSPATETERQNYARLKDLLLTPGYRSYPENEMTPKAHLGRGVATAFTAMWETIKILPIVYQKEFGRPMPRKDFIKIAKNALPMIYANASSHLGVFTAVEKRYSSSVSPNVINFEPHNFYFSGGIENPKLELNEHVTDGARPDPELFKKEERTKCPAMFALGPKNKNVIEEMSDWIFELADKYYVPVLERDGAVV
jgi:hypothetical protein